MWSIRELKWLDVFEPAIASSILVKHIMLICRSRDNRISILCTLVVTFGWFYVNRPSSTVSHLLLNVLLQPTERGLDDKKLRCLLTLVGMHSDENGSPVCSGVNH